MMNVSNCNELYENSQNAKRNVRENKTKVKLFKCLNFVTCWRQNKKDTKIFSEEEKLSIIKSEENVIKKQLFKIYITKS